MAAVAVPSVLFLVGCLSALPYVDPIRDAYQGWLIAHQGKLPLTGPPLAGTIHLGPLWFYLMALPAIFARSMLAFSLFVGVLAATKFLLAYRLGAQVCDRRFGAYLAIFLSIPTWAAFELFFLTHVAVVESAILGTLLVTLWAARRPVAWRLILLGLAFGLGLHSHPTYVVVAVPMALLWYKAGGKVSPRHLLAGFAGVLIPFIPVLWSLRTGTGSFVGGLSTYAARDLGSIGLWEVPVSLYSLLFSGVRASFGTVFGASTASGLFFAYVAVIGLIAAGAIMGWRHASRRHRRLLLCSLLVLLGSVVVVALLRARTPWYMTFALMPALAACGASALSIGAEMRWMRWLPAVACVCVVTLSAIWTWGYTRQVYVDQVLRLPATSLNDTNELEFTWERTAPAIGAWRSGEFGDFLCSKPRVELLGAVGTAADDRVGLDALLACGRRKHITIGGCSPDSTVSLPAPAWRALGIAPERWIAGTGLAAATQFRCARGGEGLPIATGEAYPFRQAFKRGSNPEEQTLRFTLQAGQALAIINQFSSVNGMEIRQVSANGAPLEQTWSDATTHVYQCSGCDAPVDWNVRFRAGRADRVYFVVLARENPVQDPVVPLSQ